MDSSEKLVEVYLKSIGLIDVRYEPDGNVPPDFLADGRIAIEVRRLNQNYDDGSGKKLEGLEKAEIPLQRYLQDYLTKLGPASPSGGSWYVYYRFSRPVPVWKDLRCELDSLLRPFMINPNPQPFESKLSVDFWIEVFRASSSMPTFFQLAGYSDEQSGGWLLAEMDTNLKHCIAEKTAKIRSYRAKYPEWWLILPDYIGYGLSEFERELFIDQITAQRGDFDKVVLLDPRDPLRAFEINS